MTAVLELHQACLGQRLQPISLTLRADQHVVLLGASGAGKTTLLKLCNGSLNPDAGSVHWCGQPHQHLSRRQRRRIGTLWQDLRLVEELSVIQNINSGALGRHGLLWALRNLLGALDQDTCLALMHQVNLDPELLEQPIRELSGGQRQRVALWPVCCISGRSWFWLTSPSPLLIPPLPQMCLTRFCCHRDA